MEFFVRRDPSQDDVTYVIIQDGDTTAFHHGLRGEDDTIHGWHTRLRYLQHGASEELETLLGVVPHLLNVGIAEEAYPTYRNILFAVLRFLEQNGSSDGLLGEGSSYVQLYGQLAQYLSRFQTERQSDHYLATFSVAGQEIWRLQIPCDKFDEAPVQVCRAALTALYKEGPRAVCDFIEGYAHLQAHVAEADIVTVELFLGLSKALLALIRQPLGDLGLYVSWGPSIYESIVVLETSAEQRKVYLDEFVAMEEDYAVKQRTFENIMRGLKRDQTDPGSVRQVGVFIAVQCLKAYDLDSAAQVLGEIRALDHGGYISKLLLKIAGSMYSKTACWILGFGVLLLVLIGPALLETSSMVVAPQLYWFLECASLGALAMFYLGAVLLPALVLRKSRTDRLPYFQLFFPRIFGAIVVGFLPLVFDDRGWSIGSGSGWFAIALIGALSYLAWAVYLHVDANKRLTMLRSTEWHSVMRASRQIFWIGLIQSVTIAVVVSTLFSPAFVENEAGGIKLDCFIGTVGIYPGLIFLWAGIALFVGAFAQLLWQT